jgi:hypothetical protein
MGDGKFCLVCEHCNKYRTNSDDKVRCTRYSMWVSRFDCCEKFTDRISENNGIPEPPKGE